jgi:hypothetical protein
MSLPPVSAYNVQVIANAETAEYGKFLQLVDNTSFPAVSVTKYFYPDNSQAYIPSDVKLGSSPTAVPPITSVSVYPKFAVLNYVVNATDFPTPTINLSAGTVNISTSALTQVIQDIDSQIINVINPAVTATAWNTYDTLTAVVAFNNNFIRSVSALNVTVANPVTAVSTKQTVTNWDVLSAAVNNSTYTTLPSNPANEITILNNTGGIIYIKNTSKSIGLPIDNNTSFDIKLVGYTSEVAVMASSNNKTVYGTFIAYN